MQLTQTALDEIESILDDGVGLGTPRPEMALGDHIRFIPTTPYPFIVVFDMGRRLVLRVVYARSDYRNMVISDWFPV